MERDFLIEAYYAQDHDENESLTHHGIKGQHWGVRRYQNTDGSLTPEGRRHWGIGDAIRGAKTNVQKYVKSKKAAALRNKKNSILARGDVNEILKNKHLFTTNELDKAISRTQRMSMLEAMTPEKAAQRKKEAEAQAKAARGKEAVDRGLYHAGQLVQMAPAIIQCGAIVAGLVRAGHGAGSPPSAAQVAEAVASTTGAVANAAQNQNSTPSSQNASSNSSSHVTPTQTASGVTPLPHSTSSVHTPVGYNMSFASTQPTSGQPHSTHPTNNQSYLTIHATSNHPTSYTIYNGNGSSKASSQKYKIKTPKQPSWSDSTTNATFVNCLYEASNTPMSSLATNATWVSESDIDWDA